MFPICKNCSKPALTVCLKGKLCQQCGLLCHSKYQHPVQFIRHSESTLGQQNSNNRKIMKSMITLSKHNIGDVPKRVSKVTSKSRLVKCSSQSIKQAPIKHIKDSRVLDFMKQNRPIFINQQLAPKSKQQNKKSIGVMAESRLSTKQQCIAINPNQEIVTLKLQIDRQNQLLKLLKLKLQKQKRKSSQVKNAYEAKLKQIRKLRD